MAAPVQDVIILFGDSLTELGTEAGGLSQRLTDVYRRKLDVVNRGLRGYNSKWAVPVFEQIFATRTQQEHVPKVRLFTIWYGANDASILAPQHVPLEDYKMNLTTLIRNVKSPSSVYYSPSTRIILITPPPINTHQWGANRAAQDPPQQLDRHFDITESYADAVKEIGQAEDVPVCDVWTALWEASGKVEESLYKVMTDGLHLNTDGYKIVYDELLKVIRIKFPEIHYENLQDIFIEWSDVDDSKFREVLQKRRA